MKRIFTLSLLFMMVVTGAEARKVTVADINQLNTAVTTGYQSGDTIMLAAGTYALTKVIEISEEKTLTIIGAGADQTVIDGRWTGGPTLDGIQILNISSSSLTIEGVTLQRGYSSPNGGAINNEGTLFLKNCCLKENLANFDGGAIYNAGNLVLINSTLTGNKASSNGGGLYAAEGSTNIVLNSIIVGNTIYSEDKDVNNQSGVGNFYMAYSAYGVLEGDQINTASTDNQSGISAEDVLIEVDGNYHATGVAATEGTATAYDGTTGYYYDGTVWKTARGNANAPAESTWLTPLSNKIMGGLLVASEPGSEEQGEHYTLTFLVDEGIRINPAAPTYALAEGSDYTFYMYMEAGNEAKQPYVTLNKQPVTIKQTQDGRGWVYRIPAVYEDQTISVVLQDPVSNLNPEAGIEIYSAAGALIVEASQPTAVMIYNITGQAVAQERVDNRAAFTLPKGIYIVRTDKCATKAIVK